MNTRQQKFYEIPRWTKGDEDEKEEEEEQRKPKETEREEERDYCGTG